MSVSQVLFKTKEALVKIRDVYFSRRMLAILLMGFSSGIPLALTGSTLSAWMASEKIDLTTIGIFSLVGIPYSLKFFWSPIMDRFVPPFLGRRRGWIFITQVFLVLGICAMGFSNPIASPWTMAAFAVLVAFFSASQDIVVDAYRTEAVSTDELGAGASTYIFGYRVAMMVSGALALILSDHMSWKAVYFIMAGTMLIGIAASLTSPEPVLKEKPPHNFKEAIADPFIEFFTRKGALEVILFVLLFKIDSIYANALITPFAMQLGFTKTDVGAVIKAFGFFPPLIGTFIGGTLIIEIGLLKSLWITGIFQAFANFSFYFLAHAGHSYPALIGAITIENLGAGMGTAAYAAFLMSLCNKKFTATQYALLTSLMAFSRTVISSPAGYFAKTLGWEWYYIMTIMIAIPSFLMLTRFKKWELPGFPSPKSPAQNS